MLITPALAQAAAPATDGSSNFFGPMLLPLAMLVIMYFLILRPQQKRMKAHQDMVAALKKGDTVETSGGFIGKIKSIQDDEIRLELAPNVDVRVLRHAISNVRGKTEPAPANDTKPAV